MNEPTKYYLICAYSTPQLLPQPESSLPHLARFTTCLWSNTYSLILHNVQKSAKVEVIVSFIWAACDFANNYSIKSTVIVNIPRLAGKLTIWSDLGSTVAKAPSRSINWTVKLPIQFVISGVLLKAGHAKILIRCGN